MSGVGDIIYFFAVIFQSAAGLIIFPTIMGIVGIVLSNNKSIIASISVMIALFYLFIFLSWRNPKNLRALYITLSVLIGLSIIILSGYSINKYTEANNTTTTTTTTSPSIKLKISV